jgi:DNA modification methylase
MILNNDFRNIKIKQPKVDLFIVDPPYGSIIPDRYDRLSENETLAFLYETIEWCSKCAKEGASLYMFGGVGKPENRPFFRFCGEFEKNTDWVGHNFLTWSKKRGYGTPYNWIFAREEILMMTYKAKRPIYFNVPYRDEERSEDWKKRLSKKDRPYQPKSTKLRYTNVIYDISEIFREKLVTAQKPESLIELLVKTSCPQDGFVVDPMCGCGITGKVAKRLGIKFLCIEKDEETFEIAKKNIVRTGEARHGEVRQGKAW